MSQLSRIQPCVVTLNNVSFPLPVFPSLPFASSCEEGAYVNLTSEIFSDEIFDLFKKVDRDERNKVAYRGENGQMYEDIKRLD